MYTTAASGIFPELLFQCGGSPAVVFSAKVESGVYFFLVPFDKICASWFAEQAFRLFVPAFSVRCPGKNAVESGGKSCSVIFVT
jgi:hypothetical protein